MKLQIYILQTLLKNGLKLQELEKEALLVLWLGKKEGEGISS